MRRRLAAGLAVLAAVLLVSGCGDAHSEKAKSGDATPGTGTADAPRPHVIGLASSLPLLWPESANVTQLLNDDRPAHWALDVLREFGEVRPLDSLADQSGTLPLPANGWLVLAQPYPFSPQENVALDDWVMAGGHLLLFADPMLTQESAYALGDRRRPQDVILLSPILDRWGLELRFDEDQARGERGVRFGRETFPVNLPGSFVVVDKAGNCRLTAQGLIAICTIGRGRLVAVADAALLEQAAADAVEARKSALRFLLGRLGV